LAQDETLFNGEIRLPLGEVTSRVILLVSVKFVLPEPSITVTLTDLASDHSLELFLTLQEILWSPLLQPEVLIIHAGFCGLIPPTILTHDNGTIPLSVIFPIR